MVVGSATPPVLYVGSLVGVSCLGSTLLAFSLARIGASFRYQAMRHALNNFWLALLFNIGKIETSLEATKSAKPNLSGPLLTIEASRLTPTPCIFFHLARYVSSDVTGKNLAS
jgi:hypothetical protein